MCITEVLPAVCVICLASPDLASAPWVPAWERLSRLRPTNTKIIANGSAGNTTFWPFIFRSRSRWRQPSGQIQCIVLPCWIDAWRRTKITSQVLLHPNTLGPSRLITTAHGAYLYLPSALAICFCLLRRKNDRARNSQSKSKLDLMYPCQW